MRFVDMALCFSANTTRGVLMRKQAKLLEFGEKTLSVGPNETCSRSTGAIRRDHGSIDSLKKLLSIPKVLGRFVIGEFTRGSFFSVFFLEFYNSWQIEGVATCDINLSWEKKGVRHADLRSPKCAPPDRLYRPNLRKYRERRVPRA